MSKGDKTRIKKWLERKNSFGRKMGAKGFPKERILIVCEGTRTEPEYFRAFRAPSAAVKVVGTGFNTLSLVQEAHRLSSEALRTGSPYDQVWCVFDRDSFPAEQVGAALNLAEKHRIRTAFSNEAFEIWYLLHFDYVDTAFSRSQYAGKLSTRLAKPYRKNDPGLYRDLLPMQSTAISNAQRLLERYVPRNPPEDNPSTEVHLLVMVLNKLK